MFILKCQVNEIFVTVFLWQRFVYCFVIAEISRSFNRDVIDSFGKNTDREFHTSIVCKLEGDSYVNIWLTIFDYLQVCKAE